MPAPAALTAGGPPWRPVLRAAGVGADAPLGGPGAQQALDPLAGDGVTEDAALGGPDVRQALDLLAGDGATEDAALGGPGVRQALDLLAGDGATEDELADLVTDRDGPGGLAALYFCLERCSLHYEVRAAGRPVATLTPVSADFRPAVRELDAGVALELSRFALCRRVGDVLALESPLSLARIAFADETGPALLAALARPRTCAELRERMPGAPVEDLAGLLVAAGMAGPAGEEDVDPALAPWAFHDLLFHARSRRGRHADPVGATYPLRGHMAPLPALKPPEPGRVVGLSRPDLTRLAREDPPFTRVLERRRSLRRQARRPLTLDQLSDLLFRAARVRHVTAAGPYETSSRPYPSGGAAYDLELYLTVDRCAGVAPGTYRYDPGAHVLRHVADRGRAARGLLEDARRATGAAATPPVLITLASRFGRLGWKYDALAYALALKNAGVLQQTLCLVATAMGLGACAVGSGDSMRFARASGTDWRLEPAVAELVVGVPA